MEVSYLKHGTSSTLPLSKVIKSMISISLLFEERKKLSLSLALVDENMKKLSMMIITCWNAIDKQSGIKNPWWHRRVNNPNQEVESLR